MQKALNPQVNSLIAAWLLATRAKTLTASIVPFSSGTALAYSMGAPMNWMLFIAALISALCIQIAVNLINDAFDTKKGSDTAERLGPKRTIHIGMATSQQVLTAGMAMLFLAFIAALPLILHGGLVILTIVLVSMLCAYIYTGGPYPLAYHGLGDLFVIIFYGWVSTMAAFWLQSGQINPLSFLLGTQIGLLSISLIAINNLRDVEEDAKAGKMTLPVRFGQSFGRIEIAAVIFTPFILNFIWFFSGYAVASALPWLLFPLALVLVVKIFTTPPSRTYNDFLGLSALLHLCFGLLLMIGFWLH